VDEAARCHAQWRILILQELNIRLLLPVSEVVQASTTELLALLLCAGLCPRPWKSYYGCGS
jgi:hypothetical protein